MEGVQSRPPQGPAFINFTIPTSFLLGMLGEMLRKIWESQDSLSGCEHGAFFDDTDKMFEFFPLVKTCLLHVCFVFKNISC